MDTSVHEVLTFLGDKENIITIDNIVLNHYSDKSKSRGSYLPLLELSVRRKILMMIGICII